MKRRIACVVSLIVVVCFAAKTLACWDAVHPDVFARGCPLIISGAVEKIDVAPAGQDRAFDVAYIKAAMIQTNSLKDVPLKKGDLVPVRMSSIKSRVRVSTDLRYPVGTAGTWLIVLGDDGHFYVNRHPVQLQPRRGGEKRQGNEGQDPFPVMQQRNLSEESMTKAEWIQNQKRRAAGEKDLPAKQNAK